MMYTIRLVMLLLTTVLMLFLQGVVFQFGFNTFVSEPLNIGNLNVAHAMGVIILSALLTKIDEKDSGFDVTSDDFYGQYACRVTESLFKLGLFYLFMLIPYFML